eukprot:9316409-Pyramimonas_sp.AAC.1
MGRMGGFVLAVLVAALTSTLFVTSYARLVEQHHFAHRVMDASGSRPVIASLARLGGIHSNLPSA